LAIAAVIDPQETRDRLKGVGTALGGLAEGAGELVAGISRGLVAAASPLLSPIMLAIGGFVAFYYFTKKDTNAVVNNRPVDSGTSADR